jgi:NADP-dependent 3-hydroxy acid dehydrogenase YdfG
VGTGVRVTLIQPGLTDAGPASPGRQADPKLDPADVAGAVMYAVGQPAAVDVSEIVIRPVGQDPFR